MVSKLSRDCETAIQREPVSFLPLTVSLSLGQSSALIHVSVGGELSATSVWGLFVLCSLFISLKDQSVYCPAHFLALSLGQLGFLSLPHCAVSSVPDAGWSPLIPSRACEGHTLIFGPAGGPEITPLGKEAVCPTPKPPVLSTANARPRLRMT